MKITRKDLIKIIQEEISQSTLVEVDSDNSGDLSPDELRALADTLVSRDLGKKPLTGQELRDALVSHISDMHKDIYGKRANATALHQLSTKELEQEHDKIDQQHKDWWYEERHREDQDMWLRQEDEEAEEIMEPEEGEDMPKQMGMGRGRVRESINEVMVSLQPISHRTAEPESIESKWARIAGIAESYDTNRDGDLDPDELRRIARELEGNKPLVKRGGRHDRIPGYRYYDVAGVHVRDDYNPRTDYSNTLDKVLAQIGVRY